MGLKNKVPVSGMQAHQVQPVGSNFSFRRSLKQIVNSIKIYQKMN